LLLRSVVEVEASTRAYGFINSKVLRHLVSGLVGPNHSCENV